MLIFRYRVSSCDSVVSAAVELHLDMSPVRVWLAGLDDYAKGLSQCKRRDLSDEDKPYDPGNAESEDVHHRIWILNSIQRKSPLRGNSFSPG